MLGIEGLLHMQRFVSYEAENNWPPVWAGTRISQKKILFSLRIPNVIIASFCDTDYPKRKHIPNEIIYQSTCIL